MNAQRVNGERSAGFQHGQRVPSACTPVATSTGALQVLPSWRAVQMVTSGWPSSVPPNHAAMSPDLVSTRVEAWHEGNGARS